jgi:hypothetical protein
MILTDSLRKVKNWRAWIKLTWRYKKQKSELAARMQQARLF